MAKATVRTVRRLISVTLLALALTGCGASGGSGEPGTDVTLLLGGRPAAVHAGIYLALERGYDETQGISLDIRRSGNASRLLRSGRVQAVLLDRDRVAVSGAVCVMALTQTPSPDHFVCVTPSTLADRRPEVAALVRALQRGYSEAEIDPESAVQAILARVGGRDRVTLERELGAISPAFEAGVPAFGFLRRGQLPPGDFDSTLVGPVSRD